MYALPPGIAADRLEVTGISCPDCRGVLAVKSEGRDDSLVFECRVQHTYDLAELLAAKEERLEDNFWATITALSELSRLLAELVERGRDHGETVEAVQAYRQRAHQVGEQAQALRDIVGGNRPVDLTRTQPGSSAIG